MNKKIIISLMCLSVFYYFIPASKSYALSREDIISTAEDYRSHSWIPTEKNVCHKVTRKLGCCESYVGGKCVKPVDCRIDTPDRNTYTTWSDDTGWKWEKAGEEYTANTGVPYNWGGFSDLASFDSGIGNESCAGNKYTIGGLQNGAVGVDCSGFVSRAWDLNTKFSTSTLPNISRKLDKYTDLREGDILNKIGHVRLFDEFLEPESPKNLSVYESSARDWKVNSHDYKIEDLEDNRYAPYTYFKSLDIDLVIDRSGSMSGSRMYAAKEAAKKFVDLMKKEDKVGAVSFSSSANVDYRLTTIDGNNPSAVKIVIKQAIDKISASGMTSIGSGLLTGQNQLNTYGVNKYKEKDPVRAMVLLTDGWENTPPWVNDVIGGIINDKIKVCTVGLGFGSDTVLLSDIARQTGCIYRFAATPSSLSEIYQGLWSEISGEKTMQTLRGRINLWEIINRFIRIDSAMNNAVFSVSWEGSDIDLTLVQPDGKIIDHATNDPAVEFIEGSTYEIYRIAKPLAGEWQINLYGKNIPSEGEDFVFSLSGEDALLFNASLDKEKYYQGEKMIVRASVEDPTVDVDYSQYVDKPDFEVEAVGPDQKTSSFKLFDDGLHGDENADDGIYGNYFSQTNAAGSYNFTIKAAGVTNRSGDPFVREKTITSVVIANAPPVAQAGGPYLGYAGSQIKFDGSNSYDPEGQPLKYRWDFNGDGIFDTGWMADNYALYTYLNSFKGSVFLEVSDGALISKAASEVTVIGAKGLKKEALSDLENIRTADDSNPKILNAIKFIENSLDSGFWQDDSRLTSPMAVAIVFDKEKSAVLELENLLKKDYFERNKIEKIIDKLVKADEILARVFIIETQKKIDNMQDSVEKKIAENNLEKAKNRLEEALKHYQEGEPAKAIDILKLVL